MFEHIQKERQRIAGNIVGSFNPEPVDEGSQILKAEEDAEILKGKKAEIIGTKKEWGGKEYMKTASGWKYVGKHGGAVKTAHDTLHGDSSKVIGKTSSGKDVHDKFNHASHKDFTSQDHMDASDIHAKKIAKPDEDKNADYHDEQQASHYRAFEAAKKKEEGADDKSAGKKERKIVESGTHSASDLPKDGSDIHVHMVPLGNMKAEDVVLNYDKANFRFNVTDSSGKKMGTMTEKSVLDNLDLGHFELKKKEAESKPIGKTTTGKDVHADFDHEGHKDFDANEHGAAAFAHLAEADKHSKDIKYGDTVYAKKDEAKEKHHKAEAAKHEAKMNELHAASKKGDVDHSTAIAEANKKWPNHDQAINISYNTKTKEHNFSFGDGHKVGDTTYRDGTKMKDTSIVHVIPAKKVEKSITGTGYTDFEKSQAQKILSCY